jgi:hypothetical protein
MIALLLSLLMGVVPFTQEADYQSAPFDIRSRDTLILGKGAQSGATYYDVVITRQPTLGVLIKLPYTKKGGRFTFDLHHRMAMTPDFAAADVTTIVEVITGGTTSIGTFTISDKISPGETFTEALTKTGAAALDKDVTPIGTKSVSLDIKPGPQSISIVGQTKILTRGTATTRIDTPNARIATVSNLKFEEVTGSNPLKKTPPR